LWEKLRADETVVERLMMVEWDRGGGYEDIGERLREKIGVVRGGIMLMVGREMEMVEGSLSLGCWGRRSLENGRRRRERGGTV